MGADDEEPTGAGNGAATEPDAPVAEAETLDEVVAVEGSDDFGDIHVFDPAAINRRIKAIPVDDIEQVVYKGPAVMCDVDIFNSSALVTKLKDKAGYGYIGTFFTPYIKLHVSKLVRDMGGYWLGSKGDSAEFMFGDLEKAIRCTVEVVRWFDRDLTEYVKDHVVAREMLKAEGAITGTKSSENELIEAKIVELREIKDLWGDEVPLDKRELKEDYETRYAKIDTELAIISGELKEEHAKSTGIAKGRLATKAGIAMGDIEFAASKEDASITHPDLVDDETGGKIKYVEIKRDAQGDGRYCVERLTDKIGPLGGRKDMIIVASFNPLEDLPEYIAFGVPFKATVANSVLHVCHTWGVDYFKHKRFDGKVPEESPLLEKLSVYRSEIGEQVAFLRELQDKYAVLDWLDATAQEREGSDFYKLGRSMMTAAIVLGIMDSFTKIYTDQVAELVEAEVQGRPSQPSMVLRDEIFYDIRRDEDLTGFVKSLEEGRAMMILSALLYSNGGILSRATSPNLRYPTRKMRPEHNALRLSNETKKLIGSISDYPEIEELGILGLLSLQTQPISQISDTASYTMAM